MMTTKEFKDSIGRIVDAGAGKDIKWTLSSTEIAQLIWHAQAEAVRQICDKHSSIVSAMRERAGKCRYHQMANSVIGARQGTAYDDIIYDPRYSDDFGDWEINATTPEGA